MKNGLDEYIKKYVNIEPSSEELIHFINRIISKNKISL